MDIMSLIPRRLDEDSCVTVGTQIEAEIKDWKNDNQKTSLPKTLEKKSQKLFGASQELDQLGKEENKIGEIDRIVDSILAAWDNLPEAVQKIMQAPEILPYLDEDKVYLAALEKVQTLSLPEGVEIIRLPFRRQWRAMRKVKKSLLALTPELETIGLLSPAKRIIRWIDLYGAKLGITEANDEPTDTLVVAVEKWHRCLAEILYTLISYEMDPDHDDLKDFPEIKIEDLRNLFAVPYQLQADVERREVREARERRKQKREEKKKKEEEEKKKKEEEAKKKE